MEVRRSGLCAPALSQCQFVISINKSPGRKFFYSMIEHRQKSVNFALLFSTGWSRAKKHHHALEKFFN